MFGLVGEDDTWENGRAREHSLVGKDSGVERMIPPGVKCSQGKWSRDFILEERFAPSSLSVEEELNNLNGELDGIKGLVATGLQRLTGTGSSVDVSCMSERKSASVKFLLSFLRLPSHQKQVSSPLCGMLDNMWMLPADPSPLPEQNTKHKSISHILFL